MINYNEYLETIDGDTMIEVDCETGEINYLSLGSRKLQ